MHAIPPEQLYHQLLAPTCRGGPFPPSPLPPDTPSPLQECSIFSRSCVRVRPILGHSRQRIAGPQSRAWATAGAGQWRTMGEPTPWHAGAPHLAGREGRRASRLRGAGPGRRGGRTVMSEEQVSRCHTHSGVAESTMCVSQWLTCSWRVTGGRRGPPAA